mmetsp:Transcript_39878/g.126233  ORF Transcript_39878/g.126233 Transcript_39878/m.126233 type:complete len:281 (-) Transcript_39878:63-905(-)
MRRHRRLLLLLPLHCPSEAFLHQRRGSHGSFRLRGGPSLRLGRHPGVACRRCCRRRRRHRRSRRRVALQLPPLLPLLDQLPLEPLAIHVRLPFARPVLPLQVLVLLPQPRELLPDLPADLRLRPAGGPAAGGAAPRLLLGRELERALRRGDEGRPANGAPVLRLQALRCTEGGVLLRLGSDHLGRDLGDRHLGHGLRRLRGQDPHAGARKPSLALAVALLVAAPPARRILLHDTDNVVHIEPELAYVGAWRMVSPHHDRLLVHFLQVGLSLNKIIDGLHA